MQITHFRIYWQKISNDTGHVTTANSWNRTVFDLVDIFIGIIVWQQHLWMGQWTVAFYRMLSSLSYFWRLERVRRTSSFDQRDLRSFSGYINPVHNGLSPQYAKQGDEKRNCSNWIKEEKDAKDSLIQIIFSELYKTETFKNINFQKHHFILKDL